LRINCTIILIRRLKGVSYLFKPNKNKETRILLALFLSFVLCLGFAPIVLAEEDKQPAFDTTEAAITKVLKVPAGTNYPAMDFKFLASKTSLSGGTSSSDIAAIPDLNGSTSGDITIRFVGTESLEGTDANNVSTYYLESDDLFEGVEFPYAGIYKYTITEVPDTYKILPAKEKHEAIAYSRAVYVMEVFVKESKDGTSIAAIGVVMTKTDDGGDPDDSGDKYDPTPGGNTNGGEDGKGEEGEYNYSQMIFTNAYMKTNGSENPDNPDPTTPGDFSDPEDPKNISDEQYEDPDWPGYIDPVDPEDGSGFMEATLAISKMVTGEFGAIGRYFDFTLDVTPPSLIPSYLPLSEYYRAYVVQAGKIVTSDENSGESGDLQIGSDDGGRYIKVPIAAASSIQVRLLHGQALVFIDTPVGTVYTVTEEEVAGYSTTTTVKENGSFKSPKVGSLDAEGMVGELYNAVYFVNEAKDITPTGLDMNDIPFYGLILLAIAALVVFLIVKARKSRKYT